MVAIEGKGNRTAIPVLFITLQTTHGADVQMLIQTGHHHTECVLCITVSLFNNKRYRPELTAAAWLQALANPYSRYS